MAADGPLAVILAAGQGKRMKSALPKVLHPLAGRPLIMYPVDLATGATGRKPVVVVNPAHTAVTQLLDGTAFTVEQAQPRGTGDALRSVPPELRHPGLVLVLSGDVPLLREQTVSRLISRMGESGAACVLLSCVPHDPSGLGRIIRGPDGRVERITEARDLAADGDHPDECNAGVYVFRGSDLWPALEQLQAGNAQEEYYLTDVIALLRGEVEAVQVADPDEALGINDRTQLARAQAVMRVRLLDTLMLAGVTIEDPGTTYVDAGVEVGSDSVLKPMTVLSGATVLGADCVIGPMAQLDNVRAGNGVVVGASHLESCVLGDHVVVGQFNRLRPDTRVGDHVSVGTHAEIKNSTIGSGSFISHFSCVLDSDLGTDVNIGAGTVTCNFDGFGKHRTSIDDGAFVGSDSILIAPLHIGARATVGAGSVITTDVPAGALAIERTGQRNVAGWAERRERRT